jgi:PAS domain S-box-containing protein
VSDPGRPPGADHSLDFLSGGGEVGALMRRHDWSASPLGPPHTWPQSLRSVVGLLLDSRFPMFVAWGRELGFLYNDPYAEILGAKHPRALGIRFHDIWSEIWPDISPLIDAAMAGQASWREDLPLVMNRKGYDELTWFTFSYSPMRDESGQVAGMFCAVSETTSKVLAERALRELNETLERRVDDAIAERKVFADIVESTDALVLVADLHGRLLAINQSAARDLEALYGVTAKVGDDLLALFDAQPEHRAAVEALWGRALAGEEFTTIGEFGDPGRARRSYEIKFNALKDRDGKRIGAYQFVHDVTRRLRDEARLREAEEALRQAQKLESIGLLTGGIAHDFNNLLAVVSNGVEVLAWQDLGKQNARVLDAMRRAVKRGSDLTGHLLAFSRRKPAHPATLDLTRELGAMRDMLQRSLRGDLHVAMTFAPDLWPVEADAGELELAILNLCLNARDAMPNGGTIDIRASNAADVAVGDTRGDYVELLVCDTGEGVPPDILPRVFEPFFTTKDVGKGSGLGLAQVYGFATQSGGRVEMRSEVGAGTTVALLLPRSHEHVGPAERVRAEQVPGGAARFDGHLLLVEDDPEVATATAEILRGVGLRVTHVDRAHKALELLADGRAVDLVLTDILMPGGMSGIDLARALRTRRPDLPVLLTTGYAEGAGGEGVDILRKPYRIETLVDAVAAHLRPAR